MNAGTITGALTGKAFRLVAGRERQQLLKAFWLAVLLLIVSVAVITRISSVGAITGSVFIIVTALIPAYLWCSGRAQGMPVYPVFAITYIWTCAVPILKGNRSLDIYTPEQQFEACLTIAATLGIGTFVWYSIVKATKTISTTKFFTLEGNAAETFFLVASVASTVFMQGFIGGWFYSFDNGSFSLLQGVMLGLNTLGTFVLAYRWGLRELARKRVVVFTVTLTIFIISNAASLLLVGALTSLIMAFIGFSIGRKQVPVVIVVIGLLLLSTLHYGKAKMRQKYFAEGSEGVVQPWEYPERLAEWVGYSAEAITSADEDEIPQTFLDRSSTIQLLMLAQQATENGTPHLGGETYAIIPRLLIPRIIDPDKPTSHEGTYLLNLHYGTQTQEEIGKTTIGWGLLNEAYANFGLLGCVGLAVILGVVYGGVARWTLHTPILSARSLFAMLLLNFAIQTEFSASVYVTALFQMSMPLVAITLLFMKKQYFEGHVLTVRSRHQFSSRAH